MIQTSRESATLSALRRVLHDDERAAREAVLAGCREDLGLLASFIERSYAAVLNAKSAARARRLIEENANVRLRARFAIYAHALRDAELSFQRAAGAVLSRDSPRLPRAPRRFALPRIVLVLGSADVAASSLLIAQCSVAMKVAVEQAQQTLFERGAQSISRAQLVVDLAMYRPVTTRH